MFSFIEHKEKNNSLLPKKGNVVSDGQLNYICSITERN